MEEAWELAALDMAHLMAILLSAGLGLTACGKAEAPPPTLKAPVATTKSAATDTPTEPKQKKPRKTSYDALRDSNKISLSAVYTDKNSADRRTSFSLQCQKARQWLLIMSDRPNKNLRPGEFVSNSGDTQIWGSHTRGFWTIRGTEVFFDEKSANLPSAYKEVTREQIVNGVKTESKFPVARDPSIVIVEAILPKFKASKTMRVKFATGVGPSFDLTDMKKDIEQLEKQCASEGLR